MDQTGNAEGKGWGKSAVETTRRLSIRGPVVRKAFTSKSERKSIALLNISIGSTKYR